MNKTIHRMVAGRFQQQAGAVDPGGHDVFLGIKRQCHGAMNNNVHTLHGLLHRFRITNISIMYFNAILAVGIIKGGIVEGANGDILVQQKPNQVDAHESRPTCDQDKWFLILCVIIRHNALLKTQRSILIPQ